MNLLSLLVSNAPINLVIFRGNKATEQIVKNKKNKQKTFCLIRASLRFSKM